MARLSLRTKQDVLEGIDEVVEETGWSRSYIINRALQIYLNEYADSDIASMRLKDKKDKSIPLDKAMKELGMEDDDHNKVAKNRATSSNLNVIVPKENTGHFIETTPRKLTKKVFGASSFKVATRGKAKSEVSNRDKKRSSKRLKEDRSIAG